MTSSHVKSGLGAAGAASALAALLSLIAAAGAQAAAAPDHCTALALKKLVLERPQQIEAQRRRATALSAGLACPNLPEYPMVAAGAAYELSMFYAGATGAAPADLQRAVEYGQQSAQLLRSTDDRQSWFETTMGVARLRLIAAQNIGELVTARNDLDGLSAALQGAPWAPTVSSGYYQLLAELNESIFLGGDAGARAPALAAIDSYLDTAAGREQTRDRANALETKARLLAARDSGAGSGRGTELDRAVAVFDQAIALYRKLGHRDARLRAQINLARAYSQTEDERYGDNIEKAIAILKLALTELRPQRDHETYVGAANNLGNAFMARQAGERNQNMLEAVRWFGAARTQLDPRRPDDQGLWVRSSVNLAMALEASKVSEEKNLQEADEILTQTIAWLEQRQRFAETVKPLTTQFAIRITWASWGNAEQLDAAGKLLEKAEQRSLQLPAAQRASLRADRGEYLQYRFAAGDAQALDQAIVAYRDAIALTDRRESPSIWASLQNNLGNACNTKSRPDLYQCAFEAYQQALLVRTEAAMPREHADTLVNLANLEFETGHWPQAAELYGAVARRHFGIFEKIEQRAVLLESASQSKRWFERAAYALAKQGRAEEGLWIAEQGKTRVLKRRLGLKDLPADGAPRDGLSGLHATVGTLVLVPIVSTKGGLVFALFRSPQGWIVRTVFLDGLNAANVVAFMQGGKPAGDAGGGWLGAYRERFGQDTSDELAQQAWSAKLRESQAWLGTALVQPVLAALKADAIAPVRVAWATQGELAVLPIHAALMEDGKPLIEHVPVIYAPSLLLLREPPAPTEPRQTKDLMLVTVGNPTSIAPLPFAEVEAQSAFSRLPRSKAMLLSNGGATAASVKQAVRRARIFHFAGHASFNREDAQQSHLLLANAQRLTVADLQATVGATGPDLVVLSACESGLIQIGEIANEFQGLPAAFLGLGTKGVVSSLWPVADDATLFLIDRLMEATTVRNVPAPEALREAQLWLREARSEELAKVARRFAGLAKNAASKAKLARLIWTFEHRPQWQPYADPARWAGFFYSGRDLNATQNDM